MGVGMQGCQGENLRNMSLHFKLLKMAMMERL